MKPATAGTQYQVPPEPSRWPAILLAVAVHALLLAFLWFGISWQNKEPVAVEAEVWDMKTEAAAPTPPPPQEAEPEPAPEPPPAPKVVEQAVEKPAPAPDINLEREKKRKEELLKKAQEQRDREVAETKAREEAKAKELADKKAAEKKKAEELAKQDVEKKEAEKKEAAKKVAEKKKADKEAKAKEAAENAKLAKLHDAEMRKMLEAAGSGGTGSAAKSSAPRSDSGYVAAITAKVKGTTTYAGSTDQPGNPRAEFRVEQLPTGEIISVKKTKSSGVPEFDDAVEKGIIKASPLPKKKDGTVERSLAIGFSMKDMN